MPKDNGIIHVTGRGTAKPQNRGMGGLQPLVNGSKEFEGTPTSGKPHVATEAGVGSLVPHRTGKSTNGKRVGGSAIQDKVPGGNHRGPEVKKNHELFLGDDVSKAIYRAKKGHEDAYNKGVGSSAMKGWGAGTVAGGAAGGAIGGLPTALVGASLGGSAGMVGGAFHGAKKQVKAGNAVRMKGAEAKAHMAGEKAETKANVASAKANYKSSKKAFRAAKHEKANGGVFHSVEKSAHSAFFVSEPVAKYDKNVRASGSAQYLLGPAITAKGGHKMKAIGNTEAGVIGGGIAGAAATAGGGHALMHAGAKTYAHAGARAIDRGSRVAGEISRGGMAAAHAGHAMKSPLAIGAGVLGGTLAGNRAAANHNARAGHLDPKFVVNKSAFLED